MSFGATAALMILLHLAPNLAGMTWSIHKRHGISIDHSHAKPAKHRR